MLQRNLVFGFSWLSGLAVAHAAAAGHDAIARDKSRVVGQLPPGNTGNLDYHELRKG